MEILQGIVINLIAAFVLACGGFLIRPILEIVTIRKKQGLVGTWLAAVAPNSLNKRNIVIQSASISHNIRIADIFRRTFGRLRIVCIECIEGYRWEATATVVVGRDLVGEWRSTRPGAHQKGSFALVIASQGDLMYGYVTGMNDDNKVVLKKWVLAKSAAELQHGFQLLKEHVSKCDWDNHPILRTDRNPKDESAEQGA